MRFPGAIAAEAARRERAAGLHARLAPLNDRILRLGGELRLLTEGGARPVVRAAVLAQQPDLDEKVAALYE
ncbi:hypothetical protein ACIO87_38190 [Streptomyces sp. NPDC087218]|uniref:hypothetical protein n=1 Tax=Streptomyces sp. NPDC087218 TaxID=3365769 RepID=UPI003819D04B